MANEALVTLQSQIAARRPNIEALLPPGFTPDRFIAQVNYALAKEPKLLACKPQTVIQSVLQAAELGLDPTGNLGSAYLVPFKDVCTFIPGYRGLIDLAVRSGEVRGVKAVLVRWGDEFDLEEGDRPKLYHKPWYPKEESEAMKKPGTVRGAYSVFTLPNKERQFCWMTLEELETVRMRSPGGKSTYTPWFTDRDAMYLKCPIRRGSKQVAMSPVRAALFGRAIEIDEANEKAYSQEEAEEERAGSTSVGATKLKETLKKGKKTEQPEDADWAVAGPDTVPEPPADVK